MVSEKDAKQAAKRATAALMKLGAHALDVRKEPRVGYVVVAYFERPPTASAPATLLVQKDGTTARVPVRVVVSPKFSPQ